MVTYGVHERKERLTPSGWGLGGNDPALGLGKASSEGQNQSRSLSYTCDDSVPWELRKCKISLCGFSPPKSGTKGP